MDKVLLYFSLKYNGDWDKIYKALDSKEKINYADLDNVTNNIECNFLTILNSMYPLSLKSSYKPPFVLFYKGNLSLISKYNKTIAVIGGENFNDYGYKATKKILSEFKKEQQIIMTYENNGLNEEILNYCREDNLKNIFILTTGIKNYLRKTSEMSNNDSLLVLSENYNLPIDDNKNHINRLISSFAKVVLFTQFSDQDMLFDLINFLLSEGKEIFAFPSFDDQYNSTNQLIKMGAKLTESAKDIIFYS